MTKLPINTKIRAILDSTPLIEATEEQIRKKFWWMKNPRQKLLFMDDGLINTMCFPGYYGAFFILNLERHREGLLSDDQLDRFVDILLDKIEIPYLKAVHPNADIEGVFTALLCDRRIKGCESYLTDRINAYGALPSWKRASKGDKRPAIMDLVLRDAPFAIALGQSPVAVLEQLQKELWKAVLDLDVNPAREQHLFDRYLDHFLIGYPELWPLVGADASRFLGAPMIKQLASFRLTADKSVVNGKSGKPLVRKGGDHHEQELAGFVLDYLQGFDPTVLDAKHLLLDGSRSQAWLDRCPNLETGLRMLSKLSLFGIPHPALKRINQAAVRLTDDGQKGLVIDYLERGSSLTEQMTRAIFQARPELYDWALEQCRGYAAVMHLAKIKPLTSEQIGKLEPGIKRRLLEGDLGI